MWAAGFAIGIGLGFAVGLIVGRLSAKQESSAELSETQKRLMIGLIALGILVLIGGIVAFFLIS